MSHVSILVILFVVFVSCGDCVKHEWSEQHQASHNEFKNDYHQTAISNLTSSLLTRQGRYLAASKKEVIQILIYDRIKGYLNWMQPWFMEASVRKCKTRCLLTDKKDQLKYSDVVLFHAPTHESLPDRLPANALFALMSMEQPKYAKILSNTQYIQQHFDLLVTYSMQPAFPGTRVPNMPITYFPLNIMSIASVLQPARSFESKTAYGTGVAVAVFTSNCKNAGASQRLKYLEELMGYVNIHSYGNCLNNRKEPEFPPDNRWPVAAQRRLRKIKVLSHYKFYLAFENLAVDDYVSEKVFEGLFAGAIPIYRGARTIAQFMPSNSSFINANDLSAKELAELIKAVANDPTKYNQYFNFKKAKLATEFENIALQSYIHPNILCRICDYGLLAKQMILNNTLKG